ncbi:hypothetical protein [Persephonella sp. IF05-L8]|uniref:hypothetical protein n=1 Tax=Persephonella sp. IF05-L8 TaxID=1158338 RepID=UPI00049560C6
MGKIIIETNDHKEIRIKTSLNSKQVENLIKELKNKEQAEKAFKKLRGILKTGKSAEELIGELYEEIYGR